MGEGFPDKRVYYTPTKLPQPLLESMKEYCDHLDYNDGEVFGEDDTTAGVRLDTRRSKVAWINWDEWVPGIMHSMMISANECYFQYDLRHFKDKIQSTVYNGGSKEKDFYGWHVDGGRTHEIEGIQMERKLSISLLLSEPDEYEGGDLEFRYYDKNYAFVKPDAGTGVIFPSWLPHRVHPVTSGVRRSLVAWMDGPLFK